MVCHGLESVLEKYNGDASFVIDNSILGDEHWKDIGKPFSIGRLEEGDFVHVFDEYSIGRVLDAFDTVSDFISYLDEREKVICGELEFIIKSEGDLIELYFDEFSKNKDSISPDEASLSAINIIDGGGFKKLDSDESYALKLAHDRESYFWDDMIESYTKHILEGTLRDKSFKGLEEAEFSIRELASLNRFERRILSNAFLDFYHKLLPMQRGTRAIPSPNCEESVFVFLGVPKIQNIDEEKYRDMRSRMLQDYCAINKYLSPSSERIFGVAFKTRDNENISPGFFGEGQDFSYLECADWSEIDMEDAKRLHDAYLSEGLISNREHFKRHEREFPSLPPGFSIPIKGKDRNKPCPCGSGRKAKKCCSA